MDENIVQKFNEAFDKYSRSEYESDGVVLGDIIEINGKPEGVRVQLALLIFFIIVPVVALIEDRSLLLITFSLLWIIVSVKVMYEITKADLYARFSYVEKTFEVENINLLIGKIRSLIGFRYSWEGIHKWSDMKQILLREKKFGKLISNKEYRLIFIGTNRKEYPIAEFTNSHLAENVAYILARLTGAKYYKIRAH
ncbi:MAG: hypothetical protein JSV21_08870 [Nitrospirota bacterium]|nr:MAG: hypothetical protein JSV21_08870 [Nitrospirota bacterium]